MNQTKCNFFTVIEEIGRKNEGSVTEPEIFRGFKGVGSGGSPTGGLLRMRENFLQNQKCV